MRFARVARALLRTLNAVALVCGYYPAYLAGAWWQALVIGWQHGREQRQTSDTERPLS